MSDVDPGRGQSQWLAPQDPRVYQIAALAALLLYGMVRLDFDVGLARAAAILGAALATQYVGGRIWGPRAFDPKSPLISGLSLWLLCRGNEPLLAMATAIVAIGSKFALRWRGKHVFNPTNFGLVVMMLVTGRVWASPGQWGSAATFGFLMASAGCLVVTRAKRADVTLMFLGTWAALLLGRSTWLGEPLAIPIHRLQSGALVLFAFFMISDPKTTPDSRAGRILFAGFVAVGAYAIQFALFRTNGLLWSLAIASLLVPVIDWLSPGPRYRWPSPAVSAAAGLEGHPAPDRFRPTLTRSPAFSGCSSSQ